MSAIAGRNLLSLRGQFVFNLARLKSQIGHRKS